MNEDFNASPRRTTIDTAPKPQPEPQNEPTKPNPSIKTDEDTITIDMKEHQPKQKKSKKGLKKLTKKQWIIVAIVAVLIAVAGIATYVLFIRKNTPAPTTTKAVVVKKEEPPKPTTEASHLTGLQVNPDINTLPVTGVMIENSPDARPQSGLTSAGVVYEAVAEGGITRFLAIFEGTTPDYIGPVRSARPYYLDWVMPYDAGLAHAGGSPDALADIKSQGVKDLDQFANGNSYTRVSSRYAPHNLYSGVNRLVALQQSKGWNTSKFLGFSRKVDKPAATPTAKTVDVAISGFLYNSHWDYDVASNSYKRSEGGKPHVDEKTGAQISPKVLITLVMNQGLMSDGLHTTYNTIGSGKMYVFQDGTVTEGTWEKRSRKDQFRFGDANGSPLAINAGQTWITIVGSAGAVSYKP